MKDILLRALAVVVVALVLNAIVAGACAFCSPVRLFPQIVDSDNASLWTVWRYDGYDGYYSLYSGVGLAQYRLHFPGYATRLGYVVASGWPAPSFVTECTFDYSGSGECSCAWPFSGIDVDLRTPPLRVVPLRPLWTGLAVNTVFYCALVSLVLYGRRCTRRYARFRRGNCLRCGYPLLALAHSGCPECGWRR